MLRRAIARMKELREMLQFESRLAPLREKKEQLRLEGVLMDVMIKLRKEQLDQGMAASLAVANELVKGLGARPSPVNLMEAKVKLSEEATKMMKEMSPNDMRDLVKKMLDESAKQLEKTDKT
jgi:hypothetical protein